MPELELYGTASCPFTRDAREGCEWKRRTFVEYDVDAGCRGARAAAPRSTGQRAVPVLVEDGRVVRSAGRAAAASSGRLETGGA